MKTLIFGGSDDNLDTSATEYNAPSTNGATSWSATETLRRQVVSAAGSLKNLRIKLTGTAGASKSYAFTVMKNGAATSLTVTVTGASDTTGIDSTNSVSVVAGDEISLRVIPSGTPTSVDAKWCITFDSTSSNQSPLFFSTAGTTAAAATEQLGMCGTGTWDQFSTERRRGICGTGGSFTKLYVSLTAAPGAGNSFIFTMFKNGSSTGLAATVSDLSTTANGSASISISAGDDVCIRRTETGTPTDSVAMFGALFTPTVDGESLVMHATDDQYSQSSTRFDTIQGNGFESSTETNRELLVGENCVCKNLYFDVLTAPGVVASGKSMKITLRDDNADTALTVTLTETATSGSDTTNTPTLVAGSDIAFQFTPTSTPAASTWRTGFVVYVAPDSSSSSSSCSSSSSSSCRSSSSSSSSSIASSSSSSSSCRSSSSSSRSSSCSSSSSSCRSSSSSSSSAGTSSGYYFSQSTGSNTTGTGTIGNPWQNFKGKLNGTNALIPGDHVYFARGDTWEGSNAEVIVNSSGTSANPIVLDAYGTGADPKFCGAPVTSSGWTLHSGAIWKITGQTQTHLKTVSQGDNKALGIWRNPDYWTTGRSYSVGTFVRNSGVYVCAVAHTAGTFSTDLSAGKWTLSSTNASLLEGTFRRESSTLYVRCWGDINPAAASLRIGNFAHSSSADGTRGLVGSSRLNGTLGSYVNFNNLQVIGANGVGMSSSAASNVFTDCTVIGAGRDGVLFYSGLGGSGENADGSRWIGGEISYSAASGTGNGQGFTSYAPNTWIKGAHVHDNFMAGIDFLDFGPQSNVTQSGAVRNIVQNNGRWQDVDTSFDPGIYVDGGSEVYIFENIVSGSGTQPGTGADNARSGIGIGSEHSLDHGKVAQNIYVINNLVYGCHWIGVGTNNAGTVAAGANSPDINNIFIINNTVIAYLAGTFDMCWNWQDVLSTANNFVMRNNLFIAGGGSNKIALFGSPAAYLDSDYNCYYRTNGSTTILANGSTQYTLATWRTASGEDANSINANPLITTTSDTSPDVHLLAGSSPCIDAGLASAFTPPSWLPADIFPSGGAVSGYATTDGIIDDTSTTIDIGYHYPFEGSSSSSCRSSSSSSSSSSKSSSSSSSSCRSSSSSSRSSSSSSSSYSSSSSSSSKSSSSSSSSVSSSSSSISQSSSSSSKSSSSSSHSSSSCSSSSSSSIASSSSSSCSSSSSSCRSSSSSSSSKSGSSSCSSSSSSCRSSSSSSRSSSSSSSSCRSSSSSSSSISNAIVRTGGLVKISSTITFYNGET